MSRPLYHTLLEVEIMKGTIHTSLILYFKHKPFEIAYEMWAILPAKVNDWKGKPKDTSVGRSRVVIKRRSTYETATHWPIDFPVEK